jgi:hypothetical protein
VNIGHHPAPLPDEPPPDFQTTYAIALSFATIALLGLTVVAIGIMVARRHQFARLVGILVCVGGLGFALWLGAHSLRVTTFVGPERLPLYDARAMLGALLVGIPLAIAAICLLRNVVREGNTRR